MDHFIETVRKYPCLWNTTAIEYRDQELKDAAWTEVMKETDLSSVKEVKLKWKKLRDSYRDALKRQSEMLAREPGNPGKRPYPWKYMGPMRFLQPYMSNRKRAGESPPRHPAAAASPAAPANGHARVAPDSDDSESEAESEPQPPPPPAAPRRPRLRPPPPLPPPPCEPRDPLDIFFDSMCQTTKRLPFLTQIEIKRCLFAAVTGAEQALVEERFGGPRARRRSSDSSSDTAAGGGVGGGLA